MHILTTHTRSYATEEFLVSVHYMVPPLIHMLAGLQIHMLVVHLAHIVEQFWILGLGDPLVDVILREVDCVVVCLLVYLLDLLQMVELLAYLPH